MARKRGFLSAFNPAKWITDHVVKPISDLLKPGKPAPPERPPPPPRRPPGGGGGPPPPSNPFWDIWKDEGAPRSRSQFNDHFNLFASLPGIAEEEADVQLDLWRDYIRTWVTDTMNRDEWEEEFGISLRDFDWEAWRRARRYSRTGK
jgi:hypothetical protein